MALHLVEIPLRMPAFVNWALNRRYLAVPQGDGSGRPREPDLGYALHAALRGLFGKTAPRPFVLPRRPGPGGRHRVPLLGYSQADSAALTALADLAEDRLRDLFDVTSLRVRSLPDPLPRDLRIGFDLRACPVRRRKASIPFRTNLGHPVRPSTKYSRGVEVDAYQLAAVRASESGAPLPRRDVVYADWLRERFRGSSESPAPLALAPGSVRVRSYRSVRVLRRPLRGGRRSAAWLTRPEVWFSGEAVVRDSSRVPALLASGVGRHCGFGFGMLLLRPP